MVVLQIQLLITDCAGLCVLMYKHLHTHFKISANPNWHLSYFVFTPARYKSFLNPHTHLLMFYFILIGSSEMVNDILSRS